MRRLRGCSLLALAGCNSIFGLNDNAKLGDGPVVVIDGELPTFKLRYLHATTEKVGTAKFGDPVLATIGIDPAPTVRLGPVGGALVDAEYVVATGEVRIPIPIETLVAAPWRVVYTLDDVVHEVIWQPTTLVDARIAEPLIGRLDTTPPPLDSGYNLQPEGGGQPPSGTYNNSRVFTTGVFLDIRTGDTPSNTRVDGVANKTFVGKLGTPEMAAGDSAILVDYADPTAKCDAAADGFAQFEVEPLAPGSRTILNEDWVATRTGALTATLENATSRPLQLSTALADSSGSRSDAQASALEHGLATNAGLPGIVVERPVSFGAVSVPVPGPMMLTLAQCDFVNNIAFDAFVVPSQKFPRLTHGFLIDRRTVAGVQLVSSIISVDDTIDDKSTLNFGTPLAIQPITLTSADSSSINLTAGIDAGPNQIVSGPLDLSFAVESQSGITGIDYFEVTVFELVAPTLVPKRVVIATDTTLQGDPKTLATPISLDLTGLTPGTYVLRIRSIAGMPRAKLGDFETIEYPYSAATVFTRTFVLI